MGKTLLVLLLLVLAGGAAIAWRPPIEKQAAPPPQSFDRTLVRRGEQLAALGDCASCHSPAGAPSYAGGVPLQTPFGTIYGTNITPEPETGIGAWSEEAFRRALRKGISRDGHHLYPAFPYNHFTRMSDQDIGALYAFVMTRDPVHANAPANKLTFPLQFRPLVAFWNVLYLDEGPVNSVAAGGSSPERGAYLVDSLAHCAACHSPRNALGGEKREGYLSGGEAEGWHAAALNAKSPSPVPWSAEALATYLRTGIAPEHAMSAGPMQEVVNNLSRADPADVAAIASYIAQQMGPPDADRQAREKASRAKAAAPSLAAVQPTTTANADDATLALGASVYGTSCAGCHDMGRGISSNSALQLPLAVALHLPQPNNLVHIIRHGIQPVGGGPGRWMPPFEGSLSDDEMTALVTWLRRQATDAPPWTHVADAVKRSGDNP